MAIMIPSVISPEVKSSAERRVFEWFQNASGTEDWIVLHSLGITTHNRVIYGETDFLVLAPKLGIFALEVKGGRVKRGNGIWYFTNRYDCTTTKVRGPFEQARDGIFSIMAAIRKKLDLPHKHISGILFGYGVMFPDIEFASSGIDEEQWQVFDDRDGAAVKEYLLRLSQGATEKWESLYGPANSSKYPDKEDVRYIASILRGDFDYVVAISAQLRNADDALVALTKEQYRCLDQLDDNPRCLIQGAAGTGKTLLALEEVKKSVASGERVALFCFNANLADWLDAYFADLPDSVCPAFVGTLHSFMLQVIQSTGSIPMHPSDASLVPYYYQSALPAAAMEALKDCPCEFDKIVIDEAQDLIRDNYLNVLDMCLKKGLSRGKWTFFGDFTMQAIYAEGMTGASMIGMLEDYTSFVRFKLTINCRNTKPICEEIQTVTGFTPIDSLWTIINGPPVQYLTWSTMEEQCEKLDKLLQQLEDSHIHSESITILSPRKKENSVVSMLERNDIKDFRIPAGMGISFSTIQAYKGLENTVIILTDIEDYASEKLMYVGLSRARSGLYVLESDAAKREYDTLLLRRFVK